MWRKANSETAKKRGEREILQPWHPKTKASYQPAAPRPDTGPERQLPLDLNCTSSRPDRDISIRHPLPTRPGTTK